MRIHRLPARERGSRPRAGVPSPQALIAGEHGVETLRPRHAAIHRIQKWIRAVETDRCSLLDAHQGARALERLRERRYLEFVREVLCDEGEQLDRGSAVRRKLAA
jgi:hypothetical protein